MDTIKDKANQYEPPTTKNISELEKIPTDIAVEEREFNRQDGSSFKVDVITIGGEDYRLPTSVLKTLKEILKEKPELKEFKVSKTGEGLKTVYTVIPLD